MSRITEAVEYLLNLPEIEEHQENQKHPVTIRMNVQTLVAYDLISEKLGQNRSSTLNLILDNASYDVAQLCGISEEEIFTKQIEFLKQQKAQQEVK